VVNILYYVMINQIFYCR